MALYIDLDQAIMHLRCDCMTRYPISYSNGISTAIKELKKLPTADVVPKSEVERLQEQVSDLQDELNCEIETNKHLSDEYIALMKENEKLKINMNAYGLTAKRLTEENESLEIELENMRSNLGDAREGWNDAECEVDRLRKALDAYEETSGQKQAKQEVAREIFDDIANMMVLQHGFNEKHIVAHIDFELLKELKKKYTEG